MAWAQAEGIMRNMIREESKRKTRVVVVDDHPLVRQALVDLILGQEDLLVCGQAEDRQGALSVIASSHPDLVIVDLGLKNSSGLDLVKDVRDRHSKVRTLVLSMQDESLYAERVVRAGASGYLSKRADPDRVIEAIRRVLGGEVYWEERIAREIACRVVQPNRPAKDSPFERLSERELEVFELIGSGSSVAKIAAALHISVSTVETYRSRIKEKMNLTDSTELLQTAIRWNVLKSSSSQVPLAATA